MAFRAYGPLASLPPFHSGCLAGSALLAGAIGRSLGPGRIDSALEASRIDHPGLPALTLVSRGIASTAGVTRIGVSDLT